MEGYRADRVVRGLTVVVSILYVAAWILGVVLLVAVPAIELFAGPEDLQHFELAVPAKVGLQDVTMPSSWGGAVTLSDRARVDLRVPLSIAPAWFRGVTYVALAGLCALMLLFLYHLRELFRRVREGAPFDARNATRLRWLGVLLLAADVLGKALTAWQASIVLRTMSDPTRPLSSPSTFDGRMIFIALVLIALAEIFRRGAALEDEQSLVV